MSKYHSGQVNHAIRENGAIFLKMNLIELVAGK